MPGNKNSGNRSGNPRSPGAGRKPTGLVPKQVVIAQDRYLQITFISSDGKLRPIAEGPTIIRRSESGIRQLVVKTVDGEIRITL